MGEEEGSLFAQLIMAPLPGTIHTLLRPALIMATVVWPPLCKWINKVSTPHFPAWNFPISCLYFYNVECRRHIKATCFFFCKAGEGWESFSGGHNLKKHWGLPRSCHFALKVRFQKILHWGHHLSGSIWEVSDNTLFATPGQRRKTCSVFPKI